MGVQIQIETAQLVQCDCEVTFTSIKEEGEVFVRAMVKLNETGEVFYMSADLKFQTLWSDYNKGGSNRAVIEPKVCRLQVPHIVS